MMHGGSAGTAFQFHKVQLKEFADGYLYDSMTFQFHKVQLKDERFIHIFARFLGFNSIRYN